MAQSSNITRLATNESAVALVLSIEKLCQLLHGRVMILQIMEPKELRHPKNLT